LIDFVNRKHALIKTHILIVIIYHFMLKFCTALTNTSCYRFTYFQFVLYNTAILQIIILLKLIFKH